MPGDPPCAHARSMELLPLVEPAVAPTPPKPPREIGLDVARALAVLGMFLAHFGAAAAGEDDGWAGSITRFVDGRAMPLFVMLSGAGVALLLRNSTRPVRQIAGRSAVLLVLGLALEHTTGVAVILQYYALFFLVALAVRRVADKWLLIGAAGVVAVGAVTRLYLIEHLPHGFQHVGSDAADIGALRVLLRPDALLSDLMFGGVYPLFPTFAFALVGMWIARQRLSSGRLQAGLVVIGLAFAVVGYGSGWSTDEHRELDDAVTAEYGPFAELALLADRNGLELDEGIEFLALSAQTTADEVYAEQADALGITAVELKEAVQQLADDDRLEAAVQPTAWDLLDSAGHSHMPAWMLGAGGWAMAVIGACLALASRARRLVMPLVYAGQMALTLYVAHLCLLRWPMQNWPWGFGPAEGVLLTVGGFAAAVLVCSIWRQRFAHGPLEALMRRAGGISRRAASPAPAEVAPN